MVIKNLRTQIDAVGQKIFVGKTTEASDLARRAHQSLDFLVHRGVITDSTEYPKISALGDLERVVNLKEAVSIQGLDVTEALRRTQNYSKNDVTGRRLATIITDKCTKRCVHCNVDSISKGTTLSPKAAKYANKDILALFPVMHFGHEGEPMQVASYDNQPFRFTDYLSAFYDKGVRTFALDTKGIRAREKAIMGEYLRLQQFVQRKEGDITFMQRISFNLYSPDVFRQPEKTALPILTDEIVPVLDKAIKFADNVIINVASSPSYGEAYTFTTFDYLKKIMRANGFVGVYPHARRSFHVDEPSFDRLDFELHCKYGGSYSTVTGRLSEKARNILVNVFGPASSDSGIFQMVMGGESSPTDGVPGFFIHRETGYKVDITTAFLQNLGRWAQTRRGLERLPDLVDPEPVERRSEICSSLLLNGFTLHPNGSISICGGQWGAHTSLGPVTQPYDSFLGNLRAVYERNQAYFKDNMELIIAGRDHHFMCAYQGPTNPPRGVKPA
ncbi:TPA: hypothetical protein HA372_01020 [Candidatus Woesearchaeota archaeon]|nr:MAG: hypothetical protein QT04_C0026G0009 [archaeon GW2011_AR11]MBS3111495.1 hypothetical protein [Candidatus Woesearchaeota archaeon]HII65666.1 hypothetical protein [Candidatus Woesearchaeota archaeon]HIJ18252.1 hypothetical protein [Candidatus Woesearchaeota archaeon]